MFFPLVDAFDGTGVRLTHSGGADTNVRSVRCAQLSQRSPLRKCLTKETITPSLTVLVNFLVCFQSSE